VLYASKSAAVLECAGSIVHQCVQALVPAFAKSVAAPSTHPLHACMALHALHMVLHAAGAATHASTACTSQLAPAYFVPRLRNQCVSSSCVVLSVSLPQRGVCVPLLLHARLSAL